MRVRVDSNRRPIARPNASASAASSSNSPNSSNSVASTAPNAASTPTEAQPLDNKKNNNNNSSNLSNNRDAHVATTARPPRPPSLPSELTRQASSSVPHTAPSSVLQPSHSTAAPSHSSYPPLSGLSNSNASTSTNSPSSVSSRSTLTSTADCSSAAAHGAATKHVVSVVSPSSNSPSTATITNIQQDDERASDTGSSGASTEAYNSEDEHPGGPSAAARQSADMPVRTLREREAHFAAQLESRGLRIIEMRPDGNCLFRALAHVMWGDAERHPSLRARIMQYLVSERDYFSQFVAEDFARYVRRKRRDGTYGNHLELQAAAELFARPIEVYSYAATPSTIVDPFATTAEPGGPTVEPIRLSFHRGSHYNAVERPTGTYDKLSNSKATASHNGTTSSAAAAAGTAAACGHAGSAAAGTSSAEAVASNATSAGRLDSPFVSDDEMERAVMALSLVEATRADARRSASAGASSSAPASSTDMIPSVVLALVNLGYSEEVAMDAFRAAGHDGLPAMLRFAATGRPRPRSITRPVNVGQAASSASAASPRSTVSGKGHSQAQAETTGPTTSPHPRGTGPSQTPSERDAL